MSPRAQSSDWRCAGPFSPAGGPSLHEVRFAGSAFFIFGLPGYNVYAIDGTVVGVRLQQEAVGQKRAHHQPQVILVE